MKFFKNKILRVVAFIAAVVLAIITSCNICVVLKERVTVHMGRQDYISTYKYDQDVFSLYSKLWLTGNMYLSNLDSRDKFIGSDTLKASVNKELFEKNITDISGKFIFMDTPLEYYLCYQDHYFTNIKTDNISEYFKNNDYSIMYENGKFIKEGDQCHSPDNVLGDSYWFTTDDKMYYYNTGYETAAVYDFDTKGLKYSTDIHDTKIYQRSDQTTADTDFQDNENPYDQIYYPEIDESAKTYGDTSEVKIYIAPDNASIQKNISAVKEMDLLKKQFGNDTLITLLFAFLTLAATVLVFIMTGYSTDKNRSKSYISEIIFSEIIPVVVFAGVIFISAVIHPDAVDYFKNLIKEYSIKVPFRVFQYSVIGLSYTAILFMINCLVIKVIRKSLVKTSLIGIIFSMLSVYIRKSYVLYKNAFARKFLIRTIIFTVIGVFSAAAVYSADLGGGTIVIVSLFIIAMYIYLSLRDFEDIKKLSEHITSVTEGDYTRKQVSQSSAVYDMTEKLNCISDGIQSAVEKRISSERMKIDLVTNVSHDLKTPLTSIISYVDLLSSEELSDTAKDYVKILQQKTDRLKSIVSDLFDLAKATSRTDINSEMIDAVILFGQVMGDMSDRIEKYGREIKTEVSVDKAPVYADGKKLYRVLQNITENALKYSLENTRIYFKLFIQNDEVIISVKNIASYEMTFSPEEITERFVRGDRSRTGDGNGLGLAIAKSFTEACGGKLDVTVDGDVFEVSVKFRIITTDIEDKKNITAEEI